MAQSILQQAKKMQAEIVENRRTVHGYAEVGFELPRTHAFVMEKLREYGYEPESVGRCGVVCTVGRPGAVILLRADMDALPMPDESGEPFAATNGHCHSCGHDCHTAMLLAAAKLLKQHEAELQGTVKIMFQSAEELLSGAQDMIEAGVLENPKVDAALALHVIMGVEDSKVGTVRFIPGCVMNSGDAMRITVHGKDVHGSRPHLGIDALHVAAHILIALDELTTREIPMEQESIVLVGSMVGGTTCNSIPGKAVMELSVRTTGPKEREFLCRRIAEIAKGVGGTFRAEVTVEHLYGSPALINDDKLLCEYEAYTKEMLPAEQVVRSGKMGGGEDFTKIAEHVPSVFVTLGVGSPKEGYSLFLHNPATRVNENALPVGTAVYTQCAMRWLEEHQDGTVK